MPRALVVLPLVALAGAGIGLALAGAAWAALASAALVGLLAAVVVPFGGGGLSRRSALRQRVEELAGERARVERLLDDLPLAVVLFTEGGLAYANPAARAIFPAGEPGTAPRDLLGGDGLADAVLEAAETGRTVEVDVTLGARDLRARASQTAAGEVALVVSDLTESRRLDAIRRAFVTNASHELKTPVAGIQALADSLTLAVDRDPERARRMLDRLRTEAVRLAQLVRDLLDLARLEEATAQRARRVDVSDVVRSQVERLGGLVEERDVAVGLDLPEGASVIVVPSDLRLIVGNLLENAVLYNRAGGRVDVSVRRDGGAVTMEVTDTGIGIPAADQDRVFERFYRVDKGRSRAAGGTGLGLSLVRHAAERHGGRVTLRSAAGRGSTFTVVLPVEGSPPDPA